MDVIDLGSASSEAEETEEGSDTENGGVRLPVPTRKHTARTHQIATTTSATPAFQMSSGNFELRHMVCDRDHDPRTPILHIDVILVWGLPSVVHTAVCQRFARDFEYYHFDIPSYLDVLFTSGTYDRQSLGLLHPCAFRDLMQKGRGAEIPERLVADIAKLKVDVEVQRNNRRRFLISGLHGAAYRFQDDVANYSAIFIFSDMRSIHHYDAYQPKNSVLIKSDGLSEELLYQELLIAIYHKAGRPAMETEDVEML